VYEKNGALRDASMYMSTEHDIDVSLYERNVAYIDASLNMSTGQCICASLCTKKN
jgi:hypothetical protein